MPALTRPALRALGFIAAFTFLGAGPAAAAVPAGTNAFAGLTGSEGIGDINNDGFDDFGEAGGRVVFGSADLATSRTTTFTVAPASQRDIEPLGDFDGDGYDDFSVGELANASSGSGAYIVYGAPGTIGITVTQGARVGLIRAGANVNGPQIRGIGDFNGDGIDDAAVFRQKGSNADPALRTGWTIILGGPRITSFDATVASARTLMLDGNTACRVAYYWGIPVGYTCQDNTGDLKRVGDVNGDGKDDVTFSTVQSPTLRGILFGRSTGFGTAMKLTQTTAPSALFDGNPQEFLPTAAGDVDADGKDDLLLNCTGLSTNFTVHRGRTVAAGAPFSLASPAWSFSSSSYCPRPVAVGDIDGDGAADLVHQQVNRTTVAQGIGTMETFAITGFKTRPQGATTPAASLPLVSGVAQLWAHEPYSFSESIRRPVGDLNGDGANDLVFEDEQGRGVVASAGLDRLAPEVAFRYAGIESSERIYAATVAPSGFTPGAVSATTITLVLDGPATVRFTVKRAGTTVGSFEKALPAFKSETAWDGKINGAALANGDYTLDVTPRDAVGNAGITRTTAFKVGGGPVGPEPATVTTTLNLLGPDGQPIPGTLNWSHHCPDGSNFNQDGGTTVALKPWDRFAGDECSIGVTGEAYVRSVEGCTWTQKYTVNGAPNVPPPYEGWSVIFNLRGGVNNVTATVQCVGGRLISTTRPGRFDTGRWLKYGSANLTSGTSALLTPASANQAGAVVWPDAFDPANTSFTFNVTMSGGNNTAEGIALAFIPATTTLPPTTGPLGTGAGALGIGGLPFTAVTLDSFKQPSDPAASFLGIATASSGASLTYAQTADPGVRLRTANILVNVTYKNGQLSVATQGKVRMTRAVTLPSRVYLAISAATNGAAWQQHVVNGFNTAGA